MRRTWLTAEIAVNRIKIVEETQTFIVSFTKQMTRRGIPTRPDRRSENASEVRNIFVSVLSILFTQAKKMTRPLTATISKHMKDIRTINGGGKSVSSF